MVGGFIIITEKNMSFKILKFDQVFQNLGVKLPRGLKNRICKFLYLYQADNLVYEAKQQSLKIAEISGYALKHINITYEFDPGQLQPYVGQKNLVVCNHATGFLEEFILIDILYKAGFNFKFLANDFIKIIPEVEQLVIPIDVYSEDPHKRIQAVRTIMGTLNHNITLAAFPSGEVARFKWKKMKVAEHPWSKNLLDMARRSEANIIHLELKASNSFLFYFCALLNPLLPTFLLFREYFNKKNHKYKVILKNIEHAKK
jgi:putative hemolysin